MIRGRTIMIGILLTFVALSYGCAGSNKHMKDASEKEVFIAPSENESVVVFMRPTGFARPNSATVFDLGEHDEKFVAIVSAKKKVVYRTVPGRHLFMVLGENADFMKADLRQGKTYFVRVTGRMGMWKARFFLKPVVKKDLNSDDFKDWFDDCEFTENTPGAYQWAKENANSIRTKRDSGWQKWSEKEESEKQILNADDCL